MASHRRQMSFNSYNATVMDLHIAATNIQTWWRRWSAKAKLYSSLLRGKPESLGALLVSMTTELASLRAFTGDLEAKNRRLFQELEALQHEKLDLRAHSTSEQKRLTEEITSLRALIHSHLDDGGAAEATAQPFTTIPSSVALKASEVRQAEEPEEDQVDRKYWRQAALAAQTDAAAAKSRARHAETKLCELLALHSMQVDECKGLQAKLRWTVLNDKYDRVSAHVDDLQEQLRRSQVEAQSQYSLWVQSQTDLEAVKAERGDLVQDMAVLRAANDGLRKDNECLHAMQDEVAVIQLALLDMVGTVTAKTAEAKAFQAYGASAREHLHSQGMQLQQLSQFQNKFRSVGTVALTALRGLKHAAWDAKDILQSEMASTVALLQTKLATACQFVHLAHIEHKLLRHALQNSTASSIHLHEQLWKVHRNALFVCQVLTMADDDSKPTNNNPDTTTTSHSPRVTANFETGDVLLTSPDSVPLTVQFDQVYSNRGRGWSNAESISPAIQSVLAGYNACVVTFEGQPNIEANAMHDDMSTSATAQVLNELFHQCTGLFGFATIHCSLSYLGIYSEHVYDLLSICEDDINDTPLFRGGSFSDACCPSNNHPSPPMVVLDIRSAQDAQIAVAEGLKNLDRLMQYFPTMEHLTHRLVTVCVSVVRAFEHPDKATSEPTKSKLQLASGDGGRECTWQDTERIRATISAENSLHAFTSCLGDLRQAAQTERGGVGDDISMRYHASKLTLLLQDCLDDHVRAKLLVLCTFTTTDDHQPWRSIRTMQILHLFRDTMASKTREQPLHDDNHHAVDDSHSLFLRYGGEHVTWQAPVSTRGTSSQNPWDVELDAIKGRNAMMVQSMDLSVEANPPSPPSRGNNNHPPNNHATTPTLPPDRKVWARHSKSVKPPSRRSIKPSPVHPTTSSHATTLLPESAPSYSNPHHHFLSKRLPFR
ncbi:hypothetical protein DYB26_002995 [Aphanomyces astaci]|uniref:Kinesin motor domain-containing protein n=1 Tax=Aphanomyces astaci TaxID=112090 RepID=A0A418DUU0_APHAT|nr:hypothetical protein DYB26_002995 [Aphanomyces astaci]